MKNPDSASDQLFGHLNERVTELEIKLTHQDDLVEQLNSVVSEQQKQIDILTKKLLALEKQSDDPTAPRNEKPPHY